MLGKLVHHIGKVAYPLFERYSSTPWDNAPRPPSARAVARGAGHDPDRVLLTGGSSAVGWGVMSHDLGLAGHLARATSAATGRGIDLEVYSFPRLSMPAMEADLTPVRIARFDAIILTLGGRESFELMPLKLWRSQVSSLLSHIVAHRAAGSSVIVVAAEETSPVPLGRFVNSIAMSRARAFNAATREILAGLPCIAFIESAFVPLEGSEQSLLDADIANLYERTAKAIVPTLARLLDDGPERVRRPVDEDARSAALTHLQSIDVAADHRIGDLLATVRDVLHVRSADLFLVDRDRVRLLAATSATVTESPRDRALSSEALEHPVGLVIPDLALDPLRRTLPQVAGPPHLRLYAGYPVESPEGQPVAVLAVVDTRPRDISAAELSLLRHFAHRAGSLLFETYD